METTKEYRVVKGVEQKSSDEGRVEGYGVVFDQWAPVWSYFRERIDKRAFEGVDMSDVLITYNHNFDYLMARTGNNSAELTIDDHGVKYSFDPPNTSVANDVVELISRGTLNGSSFYFSIDEEGDEWKVGEDGVWERTITRISDLYELGPVSTPWYPQTDAQMKDAGLQVMKRAGIELQPEEVVKPPIQKNGNYIRLRLAAK